MKMFKFRHQKGEVKRRRSSQCFNKVRQTTAACTLCCPESPNNEMQLSTPASQALTEFGICLQVLGWWGGVFLQSCSEDFPTWTTVAYLLASFTVSIMFSWEGHEDCLLHPTRTGANGCQAWALAKLWGILRAQCTSHSLQT